MPRQPRYTPGYDNDQSFSNWLKDNWKFVHNIGEFIGNTAYTGWYAAFNLVEVPKEEKFWYFIQKAQEAAALFTGGSLPDGDLEEKFPESTRKCTCSKQGGQLVAAIDTGTIDEDFFGSSWEAKEILDINDGGDTSFCTYKKVNGDIATEYVANDGSDLFAVTWYIKPQPGGVCCGEVLEPPPKPPAPPKVRLDPSGEIEGCENYVELTLLDTYIDKFGMAWNKYSVMERCKDDWCYWETPDGPYRTTRQRFNGRPHDCNEFPYPYPVIPSCPEGIKDNGLSEITYTVDVGCSWNEDKEEYEEQYDRTIKETSNSFLGLAQRMDALAWMINTAALIPYKDCNVKPELEGDWRTISFISDETSPEGRNRLRKRFRYRSTSAIDLDGLVDHWKDFTFAAGAVCVQHSGASWGTPQVWAASVDEGKRVIRHAAREAGLNPDQIGQWRVSGSRNPRFGMPGTMRVNTKGGYYWITARLDQDGRPRCSRPCSTHKGRGSTETRKVYRF